MNKKRILFVHIPKTGGRSIESLICSSSDLNVCPVYSTADFILLQDEINYDLYQGHLMFFLKEFIKPDFIFTVLRNPIERSLSALEHIVRSPNHAAHKFIGESFDIKSALSTPEIRCHISNSMSVFLGLRPEFNTPNNQLSAFQYARKNYNHDELLKNAKRAIDEMSYIGFTETLNSNQAYLIEKLCLQDSRGIDFFDINKNPNKATRTYRERLSSSDIELLYNANLLDVELFDYAKSIAHEKGWLADESIWLDGEKSKLISDSRRSFIKSLEAQAEVNCLEYTFDMPLCGDGWHTRETDGNIYWRFTGPTPSASILLQKIAPNSYILRLHIFHSITPFHLDSLIVIYNGFKLEPPERQGSIFVYKIPYAATQAKQHTLIELLTPPTQTPEYGDDRYLGVGLSRIEIF